MRYRCRVGHSFSVAELIAGKADGFSAALWSAVVALEERVDLMSAMAGRSRAREDVERAEGYEDAARGAAGEAKLLRRVIEDINRELDEGGRRDRAEPGA